MGGKILDLILFFLGAGTGAFAGWVLAWVLLPADALFLGILPLLAGWGCGVPVGIMGGMAVARLVVREEDKYPCRVCGYRTLPAQYTWDICPVCFWEDQGGRRSPANNLLLFEAQANFILHGAVTPEMSRHVRPSKPDESRDPNWSLLPRAVQMVQEVRDDATERDG